MMKNVKYIDSILEDRSLSYQRCIYCSRTFNPDSFKRHQIICYRNIIKDKQRQLTNQKSKRFNEDKFPNGDYVLITDLIHRKKQRRNQWRNDHFELLQHLQIEKKSRFFSENLSPVSSINTLDYSFDFSDEIQTETKNSVSKNMVKSKINEKNSADILKKLESFDSEYFAIEAGDTSNYPKIKTPLKENILTKTKQLSAQKQMNSQTFPNKYLISSRSIKNISENLSQLKETERINQMENSLLTKNDLFEMESINKSNISKKELMKNEISNLLKTKYSKLSQSNYELSKTTGHFSIGRISPIQHEKLNRYEEQISKVLQQYSEKYRMNEKNYPQKVLENIPKNLSIHRQRLENLKQFNYYKKQNNQTSELKINRFNCQNEMLSNNNKEIVNINNFNKINKNNFDNIDLNQFDETVKSFRNDEIPVKLNESGNLSKIKQSCKCVQLKSILKKKDDEFENSDANITKLYKDNCNSIRNRNDSEPYINRKLDKFKIRQREMNQINSELSLDNKNELLERKLMNDNSNENSVSNLRANSNCLSIDNNSEIGQFKNQEECIIEKPINISLEQKQLINEWKEEKIHKSSKDIPIKSQWSKSTPDIKEIVVKPINQPGKHFQIDKNMSRCNTNILRDQYAEAWKVKL